MTMEPSLLEFDDLKLPHIDVTGFPDIGPQDELIAGPQSGVDSNDEFLSLAQQRVPKAQRNTPDKGQQPPSEGIYAVEELFTDNPGGANSMVQLGMKVSKPLNEEAFDCFAADSIFSEPMTYGSRSIEPAESLVPPSCPKPKTRKRRRLSDSTKEKLSSVRSAGACLRCRTYKEPVKKIYSL